jgi:hypothetical protein
MDRVTSSFCETVEPRRTQEGIGHTCRARRDGRGTDALGVWRDERPGPGIEVEALCGAAKLGSFDLNAPRSQRSGQPGPPGPKGAADLGFKLPENAAFPAMAASSVEPVEHFADPLGQLFAPAHVEPPLPAPIAIGHLKVGAQTLSAIGSPGGNQGALIGEKCGMGKEIRLHLLEPVGRFLANRIAFFRVRGPGRGKCPVCYGAAAPIGGLDPIGLLSGGGSGLPVLGHWIALEDRAGQSFPRDG